MSSVLHVPLVTWNAAEVLQMNNPDVNRWTCVCDTNRPGRRCQNRIKKDDVEMARLLLMTLPTIANDAIALQIRLAEIVRLTLCKGRHVTMPRKHNDVIIPWLHTIQEARLAHEANFLQEEIQVVHRAVSQANLYRPEQRSQAVREIPATSTERCVICQDDVGTNGDRVTLPCCHAFCNGCITRWQEESPSCPLCRDQRGLSATNEERIPAETGIRQQVGETRQRNQPHAVVASTHELPASANRQPEEAHEQGTALPRSVGVHLDVDREETTTQQDSHRHAINGGSSTEQGTREECGICLEPLGDHGCTQTLRCSHEFCNDCISAWQQLSPTCPYRCRA